MATARTTGLPHYPGLTGAAAVHTRLYDETLIKAVETLGRQGTMMVTGDPGLGKTFTCRAAMAELASHSGAASIWVQLGRNPSTKEVLTQLLSCIGITANNREPAWALAAELGDILAAEPRFVWVDEAQYLRSDAFTALRTIHDRPDAAWALALIGSRRLSRQLSKDQPELLSRVGRRVDFTPLEDDKELLVALNAWHPLLAACDNGRLVRMNRVGPRGNFRDWANLLETLVRVTESTGQLTEQVEAVSLHQCGYTLPAELAKWLPR
jgi:type II secretory pathway predicted ATPase ExeA